MNPRIFRGKTVEEATEEALKTLKKDLENLEIKILDTGRNGILGLGGHPAEIEVYIIGEPIDNIVDETEEQLEITPKKKPVRKKTVRKKSPSSSKPKPVRKSRPKINNEVKNYPTEKDPEL